MNKTKPKISLIIPCYGESENILTTLNQLENTSHHFHEILVCHNGLIPIKIKLKENNQIHLLHTDQKGIGHGYKLGIEAATGDTLLLTAADLPFGFTDLESWNKNDSPLLAIGSKLHPKSIIERSFSRNISTKILYYLRKFIIPLNLPKDTQGTIFLETQLAKATVKNIKSLDFFFTTELIVKLVMMGKYFTELPVKLKKSNHKSSINFATDPFVFIFKILEIGISIRRMANKSGSISLHKKVNKERNIQNQKYEK